MDREQIISGIRDTVAAVIGHSSFEMRDDITAADVPGWDSLTHMTIITRIEKHFGVKFKLKEVNKLKNMGSLIELVGQKLAGN
jgi:acyl carrier protein